PGWAAPRCPARGGRRSGRPQRPGLWHVAVADRSSLPFEVALERLGKQKSREPEAVAARVPGEDVCPPFGGQLQLVAGLGVPERGVSEAKLDDPVVAGLPRRRGREA